jgi:hypothetical protein
MILLVFFHEHTTMRSWAAEEHEHTTMVNKVNKATTTENKTGSNLNDFFLFCIFVCTFNTKLTKPLPEHTHTHTCIYRIQLNTHTDPFSANN